MLASKGTPHSNVSPRLAQKLRQFSRHCRDFARSPHGVNNRRREMLAAQFGEVASCGDPDLGRKRLEQHCDEIGGERDPQKFVTIFCASLDIRGEISWVHVGDRGDHRGADKRQHGERAAPPAEKHFPAGEDRAFGERGSAYRGSVHCDLAVLSWCGAGQGALGGRRRDYPCR
jgi:hypothetical protein